MGALFKLNVRMKYREDLLSEWRQGNFKAQLIARLRRDTQVHLKITIPKARRIMIDKDDVILFFYESEMPDGDGGLDVSGDPKRAVRRQLYDTIIKRFPIPQKLLDELSIEYIHLHQELDTRLPEDYLHSAQPERDRPIERKLNRIAYDASHCHFPPRSLPHVWEDAEEGEMQEGPPHREAGELDENLLREEENLLAELASTRRQIWALIDFENHILHGLRKIGNEQSYHQYSFHELHDLLEAETQRRMHVERLLEDFERECRDPFVVPALMEAFAMIGNVSRRATSSG